MAFRARGMQTEVLRGRYRHGLSGNGSPATPIEIDLRSDDEIVAAPAGSQESSSSLKTRVSRRRIVALPVFDGGCFLIASPLILGAFSVASLATRLAALAGWIAIFLAFGLFGRRGQADDPRAVLAAVSIGSIVTAALQQGTSTGSILAFASVCAVAESLGRSPVRTWAVSPGSTRRALILGTNDQAALLATRSKVPGSGIDPVGYVALSAHPETFDGLPIVGTIDDLENLIRVTSAEHLMIAAGSATSEQVRVAARVARTCGIPLHVSVALPPMIASRVTVGAGKPGLWLVLPPGLSKPQRFIKRTFDVMAAGTLLILALPLIGAIALAVRLTSRGPVFYRQERVTQGDRVFRMFKFRTMVQDADAWMQERQLDLSKPFFKLAQDEPVTTIGRFLRRTGLDELPQLLDVLRGTMSLVGPRPLPVEQVRANPEMLSARHEMRAGITGWWQVNGRNDVDPAGSVELDLFYIENWSFGLDLSILARTLPSLLSKGSA